MEETIWSMHIYTQTRDICVNFIGHSGSTYWRKKDSEKAEISYISKCVSARNRVQIIKA
jgi:hypothetical protein